jgi:anti-anti-sigma factor
MENQVIFAPQVVSPHCKLIVDVEKAPNDKLENKVTFVKCQGKLVSDTASKLREAVKPLIASGGRIILDLGDLNHMDSSGLAVLVGLKVSAINHGYCMLELTNMTPRILDLLRVTNLVHVLSK